MYNVLFLSLRKQPECVILSTGLLCLFFPQLKLELLDTSLLHIKGHFKSGKSFSFLEQVNSAGGGNFHRYRLCGCA